MIMRKWLRRLVCRYTHRRLHEVVYSRLAEMRGDRYVMFSRWWCHRCGRSWGVNSTAIPHDEQSEVEHFLDVFENPSLTNDGTFTGTKENNDELKKEKAMRLQLAAAFEIMVSNEK